MEFRETSLPGVLVVAPEPRRDERGFVARTFCVREFATRGLVVAVAQASLSVTERRGTVRGLHVQRPPAAEAKLVRCSAGAIFDVIVDLRPGSPTWGRHVALELSAANRLMTYVPALCAHGFQTLTDHVEVAYQMSEFYAPECESGLRYDDPALGIEWPLPVTRVSEKDRSWPLLEGLSGRLVTPC